MTNHEYIWNECSEIVTIISDKSRIDEVKEKLNKLINFHKENNIQYNALFNHLLRKAEMYDEIDEETAHWSDALAKDLFCTKKETNV